jgi:hypothetical protein
MESEWLDVVAVNDKYIVHGQLDNGVVDGICQTVQIEQVLTQEQKNEVDDLLTKHSREYLALLRSFVNA